MQIHVKLFASLTKYLPKDSQGKGIQLDMPEGATIGHVLKELQLPIKSVKLIFLNGVHAKTEDTLQDGDRIGIFPPIGGG